MMWRIFYSDGTTADSDELEPADTPTHGVIAIVQMLEDEPRPQVIHGVDFYWRAGGIWRGGDVFGFLDQAATGATYVRQGRTIRTDRYREILGDAVELSHAWETER